VKVSFESKFAKDLRNIKDDKLLLKIKGLIIECKEAGKRSLPPAFSWERGHLAR